MGDIGAFTGADRAMSELRTWLSAGHIELEPIHVLEGPSGSGKTHLTRELVDEIGDAFLCVIASGDPEITVRDLLPFDAVYSDHFGHAIKQIVPDFASTVPYGSAVKSLLQFVLGYKEMRQTSLTKSLGQPQRDILFQLQRRLGGRRLLLIMDNVRSWDSASLRLLQMMWSSELSEAFPFLRSAAYLAVVTPDDLVAAPEAFQAAFNVADARMSFVHRPSRVDFPRLLLTLGLRNALPARLSDDLFALSGGHLELAIRIVGYLNRSVGAETLAAETDFEHFCLRLISFRLRDSETETDLRALLAAAAVIGMSFSTTELTCLAGESAKQAIGRAMDLRLLVIDGERLSFAHELLQRVIGKSSKLNPELHARFAECLRAIDPADYATRAMHHARGGQPDQALTLLAHAILNSGVRADAIANVDEDSPVGRFLAKMRDANRRYDSADYDGAMTTVEHVDFTLPPSLVMERDGLVARCLIKTLDIRNQRKAVDILGAWIDEKQELDVWQRIMQQYVVALGFVGEVDKAANTVRRLVATLRHSINGPRQRWMLHRLALNADIYEGAEAANGLLREAVQFFGPSDESSAARDPRLYWVGLSNLIANELLRGEFEAAKRAAKRCERFVFSLNRQALTRELPRRDIAANNAILAEYFSGVIEPSQAAEDMQILADESPPTNDTWLLVSNAAALHILSGNRSDTTRTLRELFDAFGNEAHADPYYVYYIGNNLVFALVADSDFENARRIWRRITPLVDVAAPKLIRYLRPRHDLLTTALAIPRPTSESIEAALTEYAKRSPGPAWHVFAKPMLLSDIQFLSDL